MIPSRAHCARPMTCYVRSFLVLMLTLVVGKAYAQDDPTLSFSATGDVLTVTASGDMAKFNQQMTSTKNVFTSSAGSVVYYFNSDYNSYYGVTAGADYVPSSKYYSANITWIQKQWNNSDVPANEWQFVQDVTTTDGVTKYTVCNYGSGLNFYVSHDNGVTKEKLTPGSTYSYSSGDTFWYYDKNNTTYTELSRDDFAEGGDYNKYLEPKTETVTKDFITALKDELNSDGCTVVKFVKDGGKDITMDAALINKVLNLGGVNWAIDLSEVTCTSTADQLKGAISFQDNTKAPSWVLPNSLTEDEKNAFGKGYSGQNNIYWYTAHATSSVDDTPAPKGNLNVNPIKPKNMEYGQAFVDATTKNLVVKKSPDTWLGNTSMTNFDFPGIDNLVLIDVVLYTGTKQTDYDGMRNVKRVIAKNDGFTTKNFSADKQSSDCSVKVYQGLIQSSIQGSPDASKLDMQINCFEGDVLSSIGHYVDEFITGVNYTYFYGTISKNDLDFISGSNLKKVSLAKVTYTGEGVDLNNIQSKHLEYIALPTKDVDGAPAGDPDFPGLFTAYNENLKGVCYFDSSAEPYNGLFTARLKDAPGTMYMLTDLDKDATDGNKSITKVALWGKMNAADLGSSNLYDSNGHLVFSISSSYVQGSAENLVDALIQKELKTKVDDSSLASKIDNDISGALNFSNIVDANLKYVDIDPAYQNDLCLAGLGNYGSVAKVVWPISANVKEIPYSTFANNGVLNDFCIPENVEIIRGSAFPSVNTLTHITTTGSKDAVKEGEYTDGAGNKVDITQYDHGPKTFTFSANLKLIETGAFSHVNRFTDVYCLATTAPRCERWAFDTESTYGNSGFVSGDIITRDNYINGADKNGNGGKPIAVLHYPSECDQTNIKRYTDPQREYSIADGKGTTDGNGHLMYWPNQDEFIRAYEQGHTGYTWRAWNELRGAYNNAFIHTGDTLTVNGKLETAASTNKNLLPGVAGKGYLIVQSEGDELYLNNQNTFWTKDSVNDYRGWHEFVLRGSMDYEEPDPKWNFEYISDNEWWTICLPFDMTKAQMKKVFGGGENSTTYPKLCRLVSVKRDGTKKQITLNFGKDLVQYQDETDNTVTTPTADGDIVLHAGHPYMLKPDMPIDDKGNITIPRDLAFSEVSYTAPAAGVDQVIAKDEATIKRVSPVVQADDENGNKVNWYYRFIGTFTKWYVPENCYFFAWYGKESKPRWFYKNYMDTRKRYWNPNTCVVMVNKDAEYVPHLTSSTGKQETSHWDVFDNTNKSLFAWDGYTTKPNKIKKEENTQTGNAKVSNSVYGFEGASSIVDNIKMNFSQADPSSVAPVYNLNGQMVSQDGDTSRLHKGIYVKNGRKFVVK